MRFRPEVLQRMEKAGFMLPSRLAEITGLEQSTVWRRAKAANLPYQNVSGAHFIDARAFAGLFGEAPAIRDAVLAVVYGHGAA